MRWLFTTPAQVDRNRIVAAIAAAEQKTSGEIRVLLARHRARDPLAAARRHFQRLGMDRAAQRNAVLIFVAPRSRTFAVIGDQAVHEKCGDEFWTALAAAMKKDFQRGDFTSGLVHGVERAGALLAEHFPADSGAGGRKPDQVEEVD